MQFLEGLSTQVRVIHALIMRETRTRYGRHQLGYLWAFLEAIFWISTFYALFYFMNRSAPAGMDMFSFLTTGIGPYLLFRHTMDRCLPAIGANKALLFYPQVRPLDVAFARALLEAATLTTVFVVLLVAIAFLNGEWRIDNLGRVMAGLTLAWLLGLSAGMTFMGSVVFYPVLERVLPIMLRPLFFISGLFFTANELPPDVAEAFLFNPMLHVVEVVRDGWFLEYEAHRADVTYVLLWITAFLYLGLLLERLARRRMELT